MGKRLRYNYRNIVPGHYRGEKGGKMKKNPGYDINDPLTKYTFERLIKLTGDKKRSIRWIARDYVFTWYKPKGKPTKRGNKRGQSKPR